MYFTSVVIGMSSVLQRKDKNCMRVQLILYSLDAPLVSAQRVFRLLTKPFIVQMLRCIRWLHPKNIFALGLSVSVFIFLDGRFL